MKDNFYNSDVAKKYYDIAESTNNDFNLINEFRIFSKYIDKNQTLCEFWSWEWSKIASFKTLNKDLSLYWIDISEYWVDKSLKNNNDINYIVWDITKTIFENDFFDITMSFFVYEHLNNPILAFKEMYRTTKTWWYIFLWFPNYWSPLFPSPPSLYWKNIFKKILLILTRIFSKSEIYKNVLPVTEVEFQPDFDTTAEINMWKLLKYIKENYKIEIIEESSKWENTENWNNLFKLYFPFKLFKDSLFKYCWPQCFLVIKKK